jgi:hypothetical protein
LELKEVGEWCGEDEECGTMGCTCCRCCCEALQLGDTCSFHAHCAADLRCPHAPCEQCDGQCTLSKEASARCEWDKECLFGGCVWQQCGGENGTLALEATCWHADECAAKLCYAATRSSICRGQCCTCFAIGEECREHSEGASAVCHCCLWASPVAAEVCSQSNQCGGRLLCGTEPAETCQGVCNPWKPAPAVSKCHSHSASHMSASDTPNPTPETRNPRHLAEVQHVTFA